MAGSSATISGKEYSTGIKVVTIAFLADDATATTIPTAALGGERGKELVGVFTHGGTMTTNLDVSIVDGTTSRNLVATNGANGTTQGAAAEIVTDNNAITIGALTVDIDASDENAVLEGTATIWLVFRSYRL